MAYFKQECKLCDNVISDENFKVIKDVTKDISDIRLLKMTLNDTENVMCMTCSSKLIAALNFKSTCLYTDDTIMPYVDLKNPKPVDLKKIYAMEKGSKQGGSMLDDREVCRLCFQPKSDDYKSILEVPVSSIQIYIPEINFEATTNPVICIKCQDALHVHSTFIKNCLDVDRKRNGDALDCGEIFLNDQSSLKIEEIEIKSEQTDEDILPETFCDIKKEELDEGDTSLHFDHRKQTNAQFAFINNQSEECSFKSISESPSADHERRHKELSEVKMFKCDKCTYETKHRGTLTNHSLRHKDPSEVPMFECDECDFRTIYKKSLKRHQLIHGDPSEVKIFKCPQCDYKNIHKYNLKQHQLIHKDRSEVRMFKCDECDFESIQKGNVKQHQLRHKDRPEVKMFKCGKCTFETIRKNSLTRHCLSHREPSEVQMLECGECGFRTISKKGLLKHRLKHSYSSEVRVFQCDECDYKSIRKRNLEQHQLTHRDPTEVRVFQCDECDYKSIRKGNLLKHQLIHKDPSEVQVFKCDECDYKSIRKDTFKQHQLRHKHPS